MAGADRGVCAGGAGIARGIGTCWWRRSAFICDHVETLYDIDIELKQSAVNMGMQLGTDPMLNDSLRHSLRRWRRCSMHTNRRWPVIRDNSSHSGRRRWRHLGAVHGLCSPGAGGGGRVFRPLYCARVPGHPGAARSSPIGSVSLITEAGPDSFLSQKQAGLELVPKLGLTDQLINTNETAKRAFVFSRGRLHELPEGLVAIVPQQLGPFLRSGLLSWAGLARMGLDVVVPASGPHEGMNRSPRFSGDGSVASLRAGAGAADGRHLCRRCGADERESDVPAIF